MDRKRAARERPPPRPRPIDDDDGGALQNKDIMNEEDVLLLAALGCTTMQSMDTYEETVIRSAELSSTPRLVGGGGDAGSDSTTARPGGFPPLTGLAPSRSGGGGNVHATDLPHVHRVLEALRITGLTSEKDFLKEQILLSFLHAATGDAETCVRPQAEARQELGRKRGYRSTQTQGAANGEGPQGGQPTPPPATKRSREGAVPGPPATKGKATDAMKNGKYNANDNGDRNVHDGDDDDNDDDGRNDLVEDTPGSRLEAIKGGAIKRRVSFAQEIVDEAAASSSSGSKRTTASIVILPPSVVRPKTTKRRKSMQERRRQEAAEGFSAGFFTNGTRNDDKEEEEEDRDIEKLKVSLKRRRREREERRRKRQRAWRRNDDGDDGSEGDYDDVPSSARSRNGNTLSSAGGKNDDEENDSEEEAEFEFPAEGSQQDGEEESIEGSATKVDPPDETLANEEAIEIVVKEDEKELEQQPALSSSGQEEEEFDPSHSASTTRPTSVLCPLCKEPVSLPTGAHHKNQEQEGTDIDAVLARHMSTCQTGRSTRRRNGHATSSLATSLSSSSINGTAAATTKTMYGRNVKRPNYAEDDDVDEILSHDDDNSEEAASKREARSHEGHDVDATEEEVNHTDNEYDEEILGTDVDKEDLELISCMIPNRKRRSAEMSTRTRTAKARTFTAPTPVDDSDENDYEDRVDDWIDHGLHSMKVMKEQDANEKPPGQEVLEGGLLIPAWINDRLFPYQRVGLQWMWELHRQQSGGILGDEMGLGKTVQVVSFLGSMAASRKLKAILIICPATMLQHWLKEMSIWAPGVRRILIHQSGDTQAPSRSSSPFSAGRSNVTTQQLLAMDQWLKNSRRNRLFEMIDEDDLDSRDPSSFCGTAYAFVTTFENVRRNEEIWTRHRWSYVVMDEAQKIRNPSADITLVCKRLKTPHRLALSGTPIQNDLRELWSLFDFVFPGRLGTLPTFESEFADPIKRGGYTNATPMQVQLAYRCALILKDLINPYLLRRLKKDIKEVQRMPGKKEQVLFCRLTNRQRMMYEAFLRSDLVKKVFRGAAQLLGAITMLRKICNHPDLVCPPGKSSLDSFLQHGFVDQSELVHSVDHYDSEDDSMDDEYDDDNDSENREDSMVMRSGKLEVLAKILPLWKKQGHRVLIFCQWKKMLNIIQRFTEMQGWKFSRLDGDTNVASRQRLVDTFNSDESYFGMLCTTRTGGVGLNLVGADRIILYDPDWNPQTDAQARERAWRFGQEREVTIYRLISAGTVEEKIYQRQIFKTALSNRVLQDPRQRRLFSQKDLKDLFTLKADSGSIEAGADGLTETTELTKGEGYVDPDSNTGGEDHRDDGETMRKVLKSKGLAGVFDHDVVENNSDKNKKGSVREMEAKAKQIAREALHALEESVSGHDAFEPESRFGGASAQSSSLLTSIAKRNADIKNATAPSSIGDTKQYTELLKELRTFVRSNVPTTNEILDEFSSRVSNFDAAVFRRLLKSAAFLEHGRWRLK